ncbi:MAG: 50S ribosomal protein L25 [Dehalococcoidia bacterium]|jgi:large subunit ribosomal protein L25|nr:50S ribosomal protein L25 [Dehalococcoidia bacterium]
MDALSLDVSTRDVLRKKVKALRRTGMIPLHIYGRGLPSRAMQADSSTVTKIVNQVGLNIPLYLNLEGTKEQDLVFVREVQHHPITNRILHVDFYRIDVSQRVKGEVPITLFGEAPAIRVYKGVLMQSIHTLSVECLPMEMPERIEIDISGLEELDQGIRVSDYTPGSGITVLTDSEELIVRIGAPRVAEEVEMPDVEEAGEAEAEGTEEA